MVQAGNFGLDSRRFGIRFCIVFLFLLLLFFALFGCFLGTYIGFLLSSNMFLYICVSVYYRFSVMLRAGLYSLGFDSLGGSYSSGRLYVFLCYQFVGMYFEFRRTVSLFIVQTFWILWSHFR